MTKLYESVIKNLGVFQIASRNIFRFFNDEENIRLNFNGYTQTLAESQSYDLLSSDELMRYIFELNAWLDYFNELECVIKKILLTYENRQFYLESFLNPQKVNKKIKNMIENNNNKLNLIAEYHDLLIGQIGILYMIIKNCMQQLNENQQKYNR